MSKIIKLTEEYIERLKADFAEAIKSIKMTDGRVQFSKEIGTVEQKANLYFTEMAYTKMRLLVDRFDSEVAWHGIAKRYTDEEEKDKLSYIIEDILVYPQEVSGTTVNTDQEKYQDWLMELDDEQFNNLRMQGHSHVNMGTSPSSVDITHQEKILDQLDGGMFYIFLIWNKKNDRTIKIYDLENNVMFDTKDVEVYLMDDGIGIMDFLEDAEKIVRTKTYSYGTYGSYGSSSSSSSASSSSANSSTSSGKKDDGGKKKSATSYLQSLYDDDDWEDYDGSWWKRSYGH